MAGKLSGIVSATINGAPLKVTGQVAWKMGGPTRQMIDGNAVWGYTEKITASEATVDIVIDSDTDLPALQRTAGVTLLLELDTGITLVMANASVLESIDSSVGSGDNKATLTFGGDPIEAI